MILYVICHAVIITLFFTVVTINVVVIVVVNVIDAALKLSTQSIKKLVSISFAARWR